MASTAPARRSKPKPTPKPRVVPGARARATQVVERLASEYPGPECALVHRSPFELLVATILSAQTTDERVNMVTPKLFERFPRAVELAGTQLGEVAERIRTTGVFGMTA